MCDSNCAMLVAYGNSAFTSGLYKTIADENHGRNIFVSPFSVHTVLAILYQGASGQTLEELAKVLGLPDKVRTALGFRTLTSSLSSEAGIVLEIANKIYLRKKYVLSAEFGKVAKEWYGAEVETVDFAGNPAGAINTWIFNKTRRKIKDVVGNNSFDATTRCVLVNAIYFKADWMEQFRKSETKKERFYVSTGEFVMCDMMHLTRKLCFKLDLSLDAKILKLYYKNVNFTMTIVLPNKIDGVYEVERRISDLACLTKDMYKPEVVLSLPKFTYETTVEMTRPLMRMGLGDIFGLKADFSGVVEKGEEPLNVSRVVQKAYIEVNEEGSVAAAATAATMTFGCAPQRVERVSFKADHPFLFVISYGREQEVPLFIGRLTR